MRPSINTHILLGEVVTDPDLRPTSKGSFKLSFRMKTSRALPSGQVFDDTHNIVFWGKGAEALASEINTGDLVQVTGRVGVRSYEGRGGEKRYITETTALPGALSVFGESSRSGGRPDRSQQRAVNSGRAEFVADNDDDDIPF